jgi:AcrR family transcriptional regulator
MIAATEREASMPAKAKSTTAPLPGDPRDAIIDALMRLAALRDWADIGVDDIAREADVSLAAFRAAFPSKGAILAAFARRIDLVVLADESKDLAEEPVRERLFDVMMRRIDAMTPYKTALRRIASAVKRDPVTAVALNGVALNSQRFMLAAAGISTDDDLGSLKLQGAVLAFARTLNVWFDDDDAGLAPTMARLDEELNRGERIMRVADDIHRFTSPLRAALRSVCDAGERRRKRADAGGRSEPPASDGFAASI